MKPCTCLFALHSSLACMLQLSIVEQRASNQCWGTKDRVLQVTNAGQGEATNVGVRRPGYEATETRHFLEYSNDNLTTV